MFRLKEAERRRLVGILGRLGSAHDGERAAAGLLADRIIRSAGLTWDQALVPVEPENADAPVGWLDDLALCGRHAARLTTWEQTFVEGVARLTAPSPKQLARLAQMAAVLRARGFK